MNPTPPLKNATARPNYGIDAPGVRRGMMAAGLGGLFLAGVVRWFSGHASGGAALVGLIAMVSGILLSTYGLGMAAYMTYSSRVGKLRTREAMLDLAAELSPWTGGEKVLDVGCGRGLLMVGAARRLTTGHAVGIDLWRAEDQSDNRPEAVIENARLEGVADRVVVETGDMRALPFGDGSFDVVLSHWAVHNLNEGPDRMRSIDEMVRVLRPGGALVLADIAHHEEYRSHLVGRGVADVLVHPGGKGSRIIGLLSGGSFRPLVVSGRTGAEAD